MDFAEREEQLEATPGFGKVPHRLTTTYHVPGPAPPLPPEDRLRYYYVNQRDHEGGRYEGHGLTPEAVIARESEHFAGINKGDGYDPFDVTVWEGDRVVAVLHAVGDGIGSYDVTRIEWPERVTISVPRIGASGKPPIGDYAAWCVAHWDYTQTLMHRSGTTLDGLITDELADSPAEDLAIWKDARLVAYIQVDEGGKAKATVVPPSDGSQDRG